MVIGTVLLTYFLNLLTVFRRWKTNFFEYAYVVMLIILMGGNTKNADYLTYQWLYDARISYGEPGYRLVTKIGSTLGLNYNWFRLVIVACTILLLKSGINKLTPYSAEFMALYFIYPFFLDLIQLRNFIMMAFVVYAAHFLLKKDYKDIFLAVVFILVGASFQSLGLLFLLVIPLFLFDNHQFGKAIIIITVIAFSVLLMIPQVSRGLLYMLNQVSLPGLDQLSKYFVHKVRFGYMPFWLFGVFELSWTYFSYLFLIRNKTIDANKQNIAWIAFNFTVIGIITMPFYTFEFSFARALRDIVPFIYVTFLNTKVTFKDKTYFRLCYRIVFFMFLLMLFYFEIVPLIGDTVVPSFHNNWILEILH